jgi:hypothetical protein
MARIKAARAAEKGVYVYIRNIYIYFYLYYHTLSFLPLLLLPCLRGRVRARWW